MSLHICIPMAGKGSRFSEAGYSFPKPLIEVQGEPMITRVIKNLTPKNREDVIFHFIAQKEHVEKYDLMNVLKQACHPHSFTLTQLKNVTEGAACTVLLASNQFGLDTPLMIANSDQLLDEEVISKWHDTILKYETESDSDGLIMTFKSNHPKWSYAKLDEGLHVVEVAEKKVISDHATTGVYWFRKGKDFLEGASAMIKKDIRTNNEFYVCPVYNELILQGKDISILEFEASKMHGIGDPESLNAYLKLKNA